VPLGQKGDWVVMAAWLVHLRTRLLLPADLAVQQDAAAEVGQLRDRLVALQEMQALAGWLERRPQLGRDVFARGRPEVFGVSVETTEVVDVVEFLWASLALFDDAPVPDTVNVYRPSSRPLSYRRRDARADPPAAGREPRRRTARGLPAGDARRWRSSGALRAAAALSLVQHLRRQSGIGPAGRRGAGAGRNFESIHVAPG
jgi:hypothetical protein